MATEGAPYVKSTVETLSPTRVRLSIEVATPELKPAMDKAYRSLAGQIRVKGFRPGRIPPRIVEQHVGRGQVLTEAVNEAVPHFYTDAVREHDVKVIGQPDVEVTGIDDEAGLSFTAEVDVRPQITLPDFSALNVTVEDPDTSDERVEEQLSGLRERFAILKAAERPAQEGDHISIDLSATVDGERVEEAETKGLSYEVGSDTLVPGLDEAVIGLGEGESATFASTLVGGEYTDRPAEITVTVRSVKAKELPDVDDDFAQTASEFDTIEELRQDVRERITRTARMQQAMEARDLVLEALIAAVEMPLPESLLESEANHRRESIVADLEASGSSLESYLAQTGSNEDTFETELKEASEKAVRNLLILDAVADAEEVEIGDAEVSEVLVRRAMNAGMSPDEYARRVIEAGNLHVLAAEARRAKAFAIVIEQAKVLDSEGNEIDLEALVGRASGASGAAAPEAVPADADAAEAQPEAETEAESETTSTPA
jgi:trigger factor